MHVDDLRELPSLQERAREKQLSRQQDEHALSSGKKSSAELRRENGHFAGLKVRINFERAKSLY